MHNVKGQCFHVQKRDMYDLNIYIGYIFRTVQCGVGDVTKVVQ